MTRRLLLLLLAAFIWLAVPLSSPAPLIYRPGEGWTYEPVGGEAKWQLPRAKDQLEFAQAAFDKQSYTLATKAAKRVVSVWPLSDYAAGAQYLVGRCYEASGKEASAFEEYQKLLEKYPKFDKYEEVLDRQFRIATLYLHGKWFKLWDFIPFFPSMSRTAEMYESIIKSGPYSDIAPRAQMNIGAAREKQKDYPLAVKAYETAADRYHDRPKVAADATYLAAMAYKSQALTAEYDQSAAGHAIDTLKDFMVSYPEDPRTSQAQKLIDTLRSEQARGDYQIALFYEKRKRWAGALVYYNEVLLRDPNSPYAAQARERIDTLKKRVEGTAK